MTEDISTILRSHWRQLCQEDDRRKGCQWRRVSFSISALMRKSREKKLFSRMYEALFVSSGYTLSMEACRWISALSTKPLIKDPYTFSEKFYTFWRDAYILIGKALHLNRVFLCAHTLARAHTPLIMESSWLTCCICVLRQRARERDKKGGQRTNKIEFVPLSTPRGNMCAPLSP